LYDSLNRRIRRRWTGHEHDVVKVLYGHAVNLVVSASRDRTIRFWNTNSDLPVQKLLGHELVVTAIDFNPGRF
jgi:WD40 repeat protein